MQTINIWVRNEVTRFKKYIFMKNYVKLKKIKKYVKFHILQGCVVMSWM